MSTVKQEKTIYKPAPPSLVQVKRIIDVTPNLRRITFTSETLDSYPTDCEAGHIKIFISKDSPTTPPTLPSLSAKGPVWPEGKERPLVRTYTIRSCRSAEKEVDIEFAMHEDAGPAINFAKFAKPGDYLGITNPGGPDPLLMPAEHYYMAGDLTAIPAIAALLEKMPANAQGKVIVRIDAKEDQQSLQKPAGVEVIWVVGGVEKTDEIVELFCSWILPEDKSQTAFWLAGEDKMVKALRRYVRRDKGYEREQIYAIPYWRHGYNEEGYHQMRHDVMDSDD